MCCTYRQNDSSVVICKNTIVRQRVVSSFLPVRSDHPETPQEPAEQRTSEDTVMGEIIQLCYPLPPKDELLADTCQAVKEVFFSPDPLPPQLRGASAPFSSGQALGKSINLTSLALCLRSLHSVVFCLLSLSLCVRLCLCRLSASLCLTLSLSLSLPFLTFFGHPSSYPLSVSHSTIWSQTAATQQLGRCLFNKIGLSRL